MGRSTDREVHHQLVDSGAVLLITVAAFLTSRDAIVDTNVNGVVVIGEGGDAGESLMTDWFGGPAQQCRWQPPR